MSIQLRSNARYMHRGQFVRPGDLIECEEAEARDLLAMKMAKTVEQSLAQRVTEAVVEALGEVTPEKIKRKYTRRDMRAE
jgi:hypothetical protein